MSKVSLTDTVPLSSVRQTSDGYLVAEARVARSGVQEYSGAEVDPDNIHGLRDRDVVRVYRPEDEVFSRDTLSSYAHRPVTIGHPREMVSADNWRDLAVGNTGGDVARDGQFVRVPLVLMDSSAVRVVSGGTRELSMGYTAELVFDSGTTPDGQEYDVVQRSMRMNHLAVVAAARGGSSLRIGDQEEIKVSLRKMQVDGITIEATEQAAEAIQRLQSQLSDARSDADRRLTESQAKLDKLQAELDDARSKVMTDAQLEKRVAERSKLIADARSIRADIRTDGLTDSQVRRAAVAAVRGESAVADKSDAYVEASFDLILADTASARTLGHALTGLSSQVSDQGFADAAAQEQKAWESQLKRLDRVRES